MEPLMIVGIVVLALAVGWYMVSKKQDEPEVKVEEAPKKSFVAPPPKTSTKKLNEGAPKGKEDAAPAKKAAAKKAAAATKKAAPKVSYDESMTKAQLLAVADEMGVRVAKSANKAKILDALKNA